MSDTYIDDVLTGAETLLEAKELKNQLINIFAKGAYGAVVYCKSVTSDGWVLLHLIASKSRVAPIKQATIPRYELCAAVLLAKLAHRTKQALNINVTNTFFWSNSMIVLPLIRKESYQLNTFVANRIVTIHEMTSSEQWRCVSTEDNPADFVSREMHFPKLKTCKLWWNGPKFLMRNQYPQRQIPVAVIKDLCESEHHCFQKPRLIFCSNSQRSLWLEVEGSSSGTERITSPVRKCEGVSVDMHSMSDH
ncbi:integrase catalytic domain-containing protein [Trichonephila clavipes]|nr:integrase catalytic domain-containing protein [Trichonephila clavipes]